MRARFVLIMGTLAAICSRNAMAGPWSIEPRLGVSADYNSNPLLQETDARAEENVAALIDLPLRYDTDELEFLLRPNGRLTDSAGYASLESSFEHLDAAAQFADERHSASLQAELARDSSLYYVGGIVNRIGVPRDTSLVSGDWTEALTERVQVQLDASSVRVHYDEPVGFNELVDYRYWSAGPTFAYSTSERNTVKVVGTYSLYQSLNGDTKSTSENVQLAFVRQLTEIMSLSTSAGYSHSVNNENTFIDYYGFLFPVSESSRQDGTVYAVSLVRQGERFKFSGGVSRALQPTGFAFLSRQDSVSLAVSYTRSERWDFALSTTWLRAVNPPVNSGQAELQSPEVKDRYLNAQATANWHWTAQWIISLTGTRITQQYGPPTVSAASTGVSINIVRQFLRTQF